ETWFVPQTESSAEQAFWSQYSVQTDKPNLSDTTIVEVPKELPKVSMVNSCLKKLKFHLASFDMVVKERTTATAIIEGMWGFEHTKACFRDDIIPFLKSLKELFTSFDQFLIDEVTEVQNVFTQMELAVEQHCEKKTKIQIKMENVLQENDRLLTQALSGEIVNIVVHENMKSVCLNVTACERCVTTESELKMDFLNKECQAQAKDTVILKLKEKLNFLNGDVKDRNVKRDVEEIETLNIKLDHKVRKLAAENEHLKQTYKQLYDSVKSSRVRSKEQCDDLINKVNLKSAEISDLNASLQEKVLVITALKAQLNKLKGKAMLTEAVVQIVFWYLDSGYSKHITGDCSQLVNFIQKFLGTVKFGNDHVVKIMGYGDYQIGNVTISRVRLKVLVRHIRTDNGTEFVNHTLRDYYEEDLLFQPMFDELLNPLPSVVNQNPEAIAPIAEVIPPGHVDSISSLSSTTVEQDAPSTNNSPTPAETQSSVIPQDAGDDNLDMEQQLALEQQEESEIEESVNAQLEAEVLTRSSHSSRTSYDVAADLSEMELKKILIDKMEGNKSIQRSDEQRNLYKLSASGSAFAEEPVQTTCQMEEPSHPVFETGAEDQPIVQTSQHPEWFSQPRRPPTPNRDWNKSLPAAQGDAQSWISALEKKTDACSLFNELLDTPIDFSNFIMNQLGVDTLTPELLAGLTYELMRGSCNSLTELEYHLEEVYKAMTDQLDWVNPEETREQEEESFDPILRTPEDGEDDGDGEEGQGLRISEDERMQEEEEADELYRNAVREAVQTQTDQLQYSIQIENDEFLRTIDNNMKEIIKEHVKSQVKAQVTKILPRIEESVNAQLKAEVLTRSSHSLRTLYAVAADLSEMELKKILSNKMEGNKSIKRSDEQRNLYKALVEAYNADKTILDSYGESAILKRRREDDNDQEGPSAGSDRGSKRRREGGEHASASTSSEPATTSAGRLPVQWRNPHIRCLKQVQKINPLFNLLIILNGSPSKENHQHRIMIGTNLCQLGGTLTSGV
nr:integrase, catalytic region, zinc finger, CCHC-type, peptidase aspartic, catalytic [Tanacetum cinerariifolium]